MAAILSSLYIWMVLFRGCLVDFLWMSHQWEYVNAVLVIWNYYLVWSSASMDPSSYFAWGSRWFEIQHKLILTKRLVHSHFDTKVILLYVHVIQSMTAILFRNCKISYAVTAMYLCHLYQYIQEEHVLCIFLGILKYFTCSWSRDRAMYVDVCGWMHIMCKMWFNAYMVIHMYHDIYWYSLLPQIFSVCYFHVSNIC